MFRRELRSPVASNLLRPWVMTVQGARNIVEAHVHPAIEAVSHDGQGQGKFRASQVTRTNQCRRALGSVTCGADLAFYVSNNSLTSQQSYMSVE